MESGKQLFPPPPPPQHPTKSDPDYSLCFDSE